MKRFYFLFFSCVSMFLATQGNAQSPRMAFIEEATQASCPPCASLNPGLQQMVNANPDKVIFLAYQVWWPGFDPMFLDNPEEVVARVSGNEGYYGFSFAPQIVMQGSFVTGGGDPGSLGNLTQQKIDDVYADTSEFDISLSAEIVDGKVKVTGSLDATADVSGYLRLRIVLAEHTILASDAPGGTNGETEYHHVFKKFFNGPEGTALASTWTAGDTYTIDQELSLADIKVYNYDELELIVFVQNDDNKFVHQAATVEDLPVSWTIADNSKTIDIREIPAAVCIGEQTVAPTIAFQNWGGSDLTSVDIAYNINGGSDATYQWTGSLAPFESTTVVLDGYTFTSTGENTVEATLSNPNGNMDEDPSDDSATATIGQGPDVYRELTMTINMDCWAEEMSWEIKNSAGDVVASKTYNSAQSQSEVIENISLEVNECYTFFYHDSYGDGLHGGQYSSCPVDGNITIEDLAGNEVYYYDGSYNLPDDEIAFSTSIETSVNERGLEGRISLSPNPTSGLVNVGMPSDIRGNMDVQVFSIDGKVLLNREFEATETTLDLSNYENGVYLVRFVNDEKAITQRVTLHK